MQAGNQALLQGTSPEPGTLLYSHSHAMHLCHWTVWAAFAHRFTDCNTLREGGRSAGAATAAGNGLLRRAQAVNKDFRHDDITNSFSLIARQLQVSILPVADLFALPTCFPQTLHALSAFLAVHKQYKGIRIHT